MMSVFTRNKRYISLYFPGGSPVSMQNFSQLFTCFTCFDISKCIVRTDNHNFFQEVKGLTEKIIYLCTRSEENLFVCQISMSSTATVIELRFFMKKKMKKKKMKNLLIIIFFIPHVTISSHFLHVHFFTP